ncbi:hypothetical protein EWB00_008968 [Schistosoma japonicum]|uniref:F-box domain-containing protein n=1 Tax=Schistosoma japonicum TaxID=6182 RepID=A0A4Z2CNE1_SCHJA|nr:hypothetical protein EWB00_008968 [Schistosoma japonicum]
MPDSRLRRSVGKSIFEISRYSPPKMYAKSYGKSNFPALKYTSTPCHVKYESTTISDLIQDTGYGTGSSTCFSPECSVEKVFPTSLEVYEQPCLRKSLRGKRRVDILSALMSYDKSEYILLKILRYLDITDRIIILSVCRSWYSLRLRFPRLFIDCEKHEKGTTNKLVKGLQRSTFNRKPLKTINCFNNCTTKERIMDFHTKEFLHSCPVCSGVAFYRPNEWPNRLHCQALDCGVSVCYNCQREHSPSEKCQINTVSPVRRLSPIQSRRSPSRSPRTRVRLMKASLRRL